MTAIHRTSAELPPTAKTWLMGKPLPTHEAAHQTISKKVGLAVFASDALSSTAYATEEILHVLAFAVPAAGALALGYSLPIALAIMILLAIVTISYQQTIHAYPGGGGAYIVARDNLGEEAALTAGASLLTDYILTVAVSISSGVAQIMSALPGIYRTPWPFFSEILNSVVSIGPERQTILQLRIISVVIALSILGVMTLINLRGVKESGLAFSIPTYFFLIVTLITITYGLVRYFLGGLGQVTGVEHELLPTETAQGLTTFLILHAFSSGCTALTGVEAISNGITAFNEPKSRNAGVTLIWMSAILSVMFIGITFLANSVGAQFSETETVISQLGRTIWAAPFGFMWYVLLGATTLILIMAANTSFADFPRLSALQAGDGFLPRQLMYRGSRLVYSYGITTLAGVAALLIIVFGAQTTALIPLYAIGVFLSFSLSQTGMAVHWWKSGHLKADEQKVERGGVVRYDSHWVLKLVVNAFGALCTAVVMLVFAYTKFADGAWIVIFLIPALVVVFFRIHQHYRQLGANLSLQDYGVPPRIKRNRVLLLIGGVHRGIIHSLRYARSLSDDITAVYVSTDPVETQKLEQQWNEWGDGMRLVVIESPYRRLLEPLLDYVTEIARSNSNREMLTIVVPQFVPTHWWQVALHMNTATELRKRLLRQHDIVVMEVPYQIEDHSTSASPESPAH